MKVICSMITSIDGYIADSANKSVSTEQDWAQFQILAKRYNNFVVGRKTYDRGGFENVTGCDFKVIVSTQLLSVKGFTTANSPRGVIALLKDKVEAIYLVGGGQLNRAFLQEGLINELVLTVQPKIIGSGTKLFDGFAVDSRLNLLSHKTLTNDRVQLAYSMKGGGI